MSRHITNEEFGLKIGCDATMASRLRNGQRLPSRERLEQIVRVYGSDDPSFGSRALLASSKGPDHFAEFLRVEIFDKEDRDNAQS